MCGIEDKVSAEIEAGVNERVSEEGGRRLSTAMRRYLRQLLRSMSPCRLSRTNPVGVLDGNRVEGR